MSMQKIYLVLFDQPPNTSCRSPVKTRSTGHDFYCETPRSGPVAHFGVREACIAKNSHYTAASHSAQCYSEVHQHVLHSKVALTANQKENSRITCPVGERLPFLIFGGTVLGHRECGLLKGRILSATLRIASQYGAGRLIGSKPVSRSHRRVMLSRFLGSTFALAGCNILLAVVRQIPVIRIRLNRRAVQHYAE